MRLKATRALALSQDAVVLDLARHAERLLSGAGRDGHLPARRGRSSTAVLGTAG